MRRRLALTAAVAALATTLAALAVEGRVTDRTMRNRRATMAHSLRAVARAS